MSSAQILTQHVKALKLRLVYDSLGSIELHNVHTFSQLVVIFTKIHHKIMFKRLKMWSGYFGVINIYLTYRSVRRTFNFACVFRTLLFV